MHPNYFLRIFATEIIKMQNYDIRDCFTTFRLARTTYLWHEDHERRPTENGRIRITTYSWTNDHKPVYRHAYRHICYLRRTVVVGHYSHDGIVRECRTAHECAVKKEAGVNLIHSCLLMIAECGGALCAASFGYFVFKVMSQGFGLSVEPKRVALSPMALKRRSCK